MIYPTTSCLLLQFIKAGIICRCFTYASVPQLGQLEGQAQLGLALVPIGSLEQTFGPKGRGRCLLI